MSRYDQNQLKDALAGAKPLQSLTEGGAGVMARMMDQIGVQEPMAPAPAPVAPAAQWKPVLGGPEV